MPRIALLSDVHGNLEALTAVLAQVKASAPDLIAVLGDSINYGPNPRECLELLTPLAAVMLCGNHEKEAAQPDLDAMADDAREMLAWTVEVLAGCPAWEALRDRVLADGEDAARHTLGDGAYLVHATQAKPYEQYLWPGHPNYHLHLNAQLDTSLAELLGGFTERHSFVGHTHVPTVLTGYENRELFPIAQDWNRRFTFIGPRTVFYVPAGDLRLEGLSQCKVVVNPGSVGQPRDGDPRASWALYDGDSVTFHRAEYDFTRTAAKIRKLPLALETRRYFADRLADGR